MKTTQNNREFLFQKIFLFIVRNFMFFFSNYCSYSPSAKITPYDGQYRWEHLTMAIANGYTLRWPSPMAISTCAIADENRRLFAPMPMLRWHRENHRDHDGDGHRTIGFAIGTSVLHRRCRPLVMN